VVSIRQLLRYQLDFTTWATERMLTAAAGLNPEELSHDFKTSDKSVLGTLTHIYRAERIWLKRLQGQKAEFRVEGDDTLVALQRDWPVLRGGWADWARDLGEDTPGTEIAYADLKGNPYTQPIWTIVQQVVNHSSHHRGQAVGFIRALGHTPPNVDLITFSRQRI
jgi:uncharacterized damage-inducible protein DinB